MQFKNGYLFCNTTDLDEEDLRANPKPILRRPAQKPEEPISELEVTTEILPEEQSETTETVPVLLVNGATKT